MEAKINKHGDTTAQWLSEFSAGDSSSCSDVERRECGESAISPGACLGMLSILSFRLLNVALTVMMGFHADNWYTYCLGSTMLNTINRLNNPACWHEQVWVAQEMKYAD